VGRDSNQTAYDCALFDWHASLNDTIAMLWVLADISYALECQSSFERFTRPSQFRSNKAFFDKWVKEGSYSTSEIKILKYKKVKSDDGYHTLAEVCASLQKGRENKDLVTFHGNVFRAESFLFPDRIDDSIVRWTQ
jgi:hypothetical protein